MEAVIGTESGESYQVELEDSQIQALTGMQIGDEVDGSVLGLNGYTLRVTGGSDREGFPMMERVEGTGRKSMLLRDGTGARDLEEGERRRKSVRGNTVSGQLSQLNLQVVEEGDEGIEKLLGEDEEQEDQADTGAAEESGDEEAEQDGEEQEGEQERDGADEAEEEDGETTEEAEEDGA